MTFISVKKKIHSYFRGPLRLYELYEKNLTNLIYLASEIHNQDHIMSFFSQLITYHTFFVETTSKKLQQKLLPRSSRAS